MFDISYASAVGSIQYVGQCTRPDVAFALSVKSRHQACAAQTKEPRSHHRSKHILRRYHLLREMVGRSDVRMDQVTSAENMADSLTKSVSQIAHAQHLVQSEDVVKTMGSKIESVTYKCMTVKSPMRSDMVRAFRVCGQRLVEYGIVFYDNQ
ncbi:UNVERIFIED_CONTAM: hypothetical protein Scaly_1159700 [Sesamum calycinum]|uniref:Uncharacterized protein n=1 Tax=Sesamum calycinum TaxID=2727403 RepID=A0AAW2Q2G7_9LAMI